MQSRHAVAARGIFALSLPQVQHWLLLCATLTGLTAMHILGHAGPGHTMRGAGAQVSDDYAAWPGHTMTPTLIAGQRQVAAPVLACSRGCVRLGGGHPANGQSEGWPVCLAIVVLFGITVLLRWLLRAVAAFAPLLDRAGPLAAAARAPPRSLLGLRLVDVSVLRT